MTQIATLLAQLKAAETAYRLGKPTMTDATYDQIRDELDDLCAGEDPDMSDVKEALAFLASIGGDDVADDSKWIKVRHTAPMTSLNKAVNPQKLLEWHQTCGSRSGFIVSVKMDGFSISLRYSGGSLTQALTRGKDGEFGEDITRNVKKMKGVVLNIPGFNGHLRAEIVLTHTDWKKYFPTYANPRNSAVGIAKDEVGDGCKHLTVMHYQMLKDGGTPILKKSTEFKALEKVGCAVTPWEEVATFAGVVAVFDTYVAFKRAATDFDIDGLVVEFDDLTVMENLGELNKRPRGAVAAKFPPDAKETPLRGIKWQVGKSGRVTPVSWFDTVNLAGANVSNATLHNLSNIEKICKPLKAKCLCVGDKIIVSRRGDVIPGVESLVSSNGGTPLLPPDNCPECGTNLIMNGEYLVCYGEDCPAQVLGGISRWCKKIGLLGIGDSIIEALIEHAGVTDAADLYTLDPKKIEGIPTGSDGSRMGRTAYIIVDELKAKSEVPLPIFVGSLGIPLCARSMCQVIVDAGYDSLEAMENATEAEIAAIPGMGATKAAEFVKGFRLRRTLMDKLLDNGVTLKAKAVGVLSGKWVCMTGFRSPEMSAAIEAAGGLCKDSVGKGLTYLVQKDASSQSTKSQKALSLGVEVIGIDDMWAILGRGPGGGAGTMPVIATAARTQRKVQAPAAPPVAAPVNALNLFDDD